MAAIITGPADMINLALGRIGFSDRIGSIYEGSRAAKQAIDLYSQTRDEMMRAVDYGFAERNIQMTLLKQAPVTGYFPPNLWDPTQNPPIPWVYEYAYPGDCLKVRAVKPLPAFVMDFDPQPNVFTIANDPNLPPLISISPGAGWSVLSSGPGAGTGAPQKVILCNVPQAMLVYTGQITDPTQWESDYIEAFAAELGRRMAPVLANLEAAKFAAADAAQATAAAEAAEG